MEYEFFVGSYGNEKEENIIKCSLNAKTGEIKKIYGFCGIRNPSWLSANAAGTVLYAVEEVAPEGRLHAFGIGEGGLQHKTSLPAGGADPCHICMDSQEEHLMVSNYTSGSFAVYRLDSQKLPASLEDFIQDTGSGTNPARQEGPHVHFGKVAGGRVFVVDLGTDTVSVYHLDANAGKLEDIQKNLRLPDGAGPRHLELHPKIPGFAYVACELGSCVASFREKRGQYRLEGIFSTLPEGCSQENTVAAVRIWENRIFISNRGHDSIAVFSLQEDGGLDLQQIVPAGGKTPRDFVILGGYMVVANQGSDEITALRINPATKLPEQTGISIPMDSPTCICPVRKGSYNSAQEICLPQGKSIGK